MIARYLSFGYSLCFSDLPAFHSHTVDSLIQTSTLARKITVRSRKASQPTRVVDSAVCLTFRHQWETKRRW